MKLIWNFRFWSCAVFYPPRAPSDKRLRCAALESLLPPLHSSPRAVELRGKTLRKSQAPVTVLHVDNKLEKNHNPELLPLLLPPPKHDLLSPGIKRRLARLGVFSFLFSITHMESWVEARCVIFLLSDQMKHHQKGPFQNKSAGLSPHSFSSFKNNQTVEIKNGLPGNSLYHLRVCPSHLVVAFQ